MLLLSCPAPRFRATSATRNRGDCAPTVSELETHPPPRKRDDGERLDSCDCTWGKLGNHLYKPYKIYKFCKR